jgi:hypothetical protein
MRIGEESRMIHWATADIRKCGSHKANNEGPKYLSGDLRVSNNDVRLFALPL